MSKTEMMNPCVWLQTYDGSIQQVEQEIAMFCPFICQELILLPQQGSSKTSPICLPQQVTPAILTLILDYCRFHHVKGRSNKERKSYDEKFVRIDAPRLCELTSAAKYLQLNPLYDLTCHAITRIIEGKSSEEIRDIFHLPDDLMEEEKLELMLNLTCDPSIRLLNSLYAKKREQLIELKRVTKNVEVEDEDVVDGRSVDELLSFINGSNDGETKRKKTCKNKKNRRKKKDQQKNSSLKEEDDLVVEFDDEIDQALQERIDREVEEFARRLNCSWEERKKEILRDAGNHREIIA
ncbi:putative S-phase kinase-associated protein [Medicago truncatula]|uniref:Putative S-phase kinase-associated protein n=2 Tax=Medicago truncatula TaxID=3880 RepID=A0A072TL31_MEDTR|nr:SKP1 family, tetramerization domain protein [Medicago truncatula]RHN38669.1 putative S-phase kinase-associated protein [Medicago truncatula]